VAVFGGEPVRRRTSTPVGIALAFGTAGMTAAAIIASVIPAADTGWRFGIVAATLFVFAAVSLDQRALAGVALIAFLITNGFLEDRFGQLSWHGSKDIWLGLLLIIAGGVGLATGAAYRFVRDVRQRYRRADLVTVPEQRGVHHMNGHPAIRE
jgi:hypothetical protein